MKRPTFFHQAYGLAIRSEVKLSESVSDADGAFDLDVRLQPVRLPQAGRGGPTHFEFRPGRQLLHWRDVGTFLILDREIHVDVAPDIPEDLVRLPLLGPVMALYLHRIGKLVLHASAVGSDTRSVVFLGDKGAGKSTTAAALVARGHSLLTDDVLAIDFPPAGPSIAPGFPEIKLDPGLPAGVFGGIDIGSSSAIPGTSKRRLRLNLFSHRSVPPGLFCVLRRGRAAALQMLPPQEALAELIRFSYVWRFGREALDERALAIHLKQCAELVRTSRVCRLEVPHDFDRLGEALDLIEGELA